MDEHIESVLARALVNRPKTALHDIIEILGRYSAGFSPVEKSAIALERKARASGGDASRRARRG